MCFVTLICSLVGKNPCSCAALAFWGCYVKLKQPAKAETTPKKQLTPSDSKPGVALQMTSFNFDFLSDFVCLVNFDKFEALEAFEARPGSALLHRLGHCLSAPWTGAKLSSTSGACLPTMEIGLRHLGTVAQTTKLLLELRVLSVLKHLKHLRHLQSSSNFTTWSHYVLVKLYMSCLGWIVLASRQHFRFSLPCFCRRPDKSAFVLIMQNFTSIGAHLSKSPKNRSISFKLVRSFLHSKHHELGLKSGFVATWRILHLLQ